MRPPRLRCTLFPLIYPPHLLVLPATLGLHLFWQTYPYFRALYVISVRRTKSLLTASFRFHLTMDTLAVLLYTSSLPRRVRDFHPLERAHGAQTKKASAQNRAKALKIMRFLGLVASQGGLFHLPENTFLKKVLQKRLNTKIFISDKPEFCGAIGAGLFAVDSDRLLERLECNALNINPKNLVILIGTNDIGIGVPTEYTLKNIKEILQRTQTLCSNTAAKSSIRA